jgi:hypothetical protein
MQLYVIQIALTLCGKCVPNREVLVYYLKSLIQTIVNIKQTKEA